MLHAYKVPLLNNAPEAAILFLRIRTHSLHGQHIFCVSGMEHSMQQSPRPSVLGPCLSSNCGLETPKPLRSHCSIAIAVIVVACAGTLDSELQTPKKGGQVGPTAPIIQQDLAAHQPFGCLLLVAGGSKRHVGCPAHSLPYKKCRRFPDSLPACRLLRSSTRCRQLLVRSQSTQLQRCWECR